MLIKQQEIGRAQTYTSLLCVSVCKLVENNFNTILGKQVSAFFLSLFTQDHGMTWNLFYSELLLFLFGFGLARGSGFIELDRIVCTTFSSNAIHTQHTNTQRYTFAHGFDRNIHLVSEWRWKSARIFYTTSIHKFNGIFAYIWFYHFISAVRCLFSWAWE